MENKIGEYIKCAEDVVEYENIEIYNALKASNALNRQIKYQRRAGAVCLNKGQRKVLIGLEKSAENDYVIIPVDVVIETESAMKPADDFRCWPPPIFLVAVSVIQVCKHIKQY